MKLNDVLVNSIINLGNELSHSCAYNIASQNDLETFSKLSKDDLVKTSFELSCKLVDVLNKLGRIKTFIQVSNENSNIRYYENT